MLTPDVLSKIHELYPGFNFSSEAQKQLETRLLYLNEVTEDDDFDDCEDCNDNNDYDSIDDYGKSGEKYGWYKGWSDDVIDDAFEGDPENTWNVD
jgi:hypothetical protein